MMDQKRTPGVVGRALIEGDKQRPHRPRDQRSLSRCCPLHSRRMYRQWADVALWLLAFVAVWGAVIYFGLEPVHR